MAMRRLIANDYTPRFDEADTLRGIVILLPRLFAGTPRSPPQRRRIAGFQ